MPEPYIEPINFTVVPFFFFFLEAVFQTISVWPRKENV